MCGESLLTGSFGSQTRSHWQVALVLWVPIPPHPVNAIKRTTRWSVCTLVTGIYQQMRQETVQPACRGSCLTHPIRAKIFIRFGSPVPRISAKSARRFISVSISREPSRAGVHRGCSVNCPVTVLKRAVNQPRPVWLIRPESRYSKTLCNQDATLRVCFAAPDPAVSCRSYQPVLPGIDSLRNTRKSPR